MAPRDFEDELAAARMKAGNAGEWIEDAMRDLGPLATGRLPVDTKIMLAQAMLAMATFAVVDAIAVELRTGKLWTPERLEGFAATAGVRGVAAALREYDVPVPEEPPPVELDEDPMDRGLSESEEIAQAEEMHHRAQRVDEDPEPPDFGQDSADL